MQNNNKETDIIDITPTRVLPINNPVGTNAIIPSSQCKKLARDIWQMLPEQTEEKKQKLYQLVHQNNYEKLLDIRNTVQNHIVNNNQQNYLTVHDNRQEIDQRSYQYDNQAHYNLTAYDQSSEIDYYDQRVEYQIDVHHNYYGGNNEPPQIVYVPVQGNGGGGNTTNNYNLNDWWITFCLIIVAGIGVLALFQGIGLRLGEHTNNQNNGGIESVGY